jgi:hypothetical protein
MKAILIALLIAFATPVLSKDMCGDYKAFSKSMLKINSKKVFEYTSNAKAEIEVWVNSNKVIVISKVDELFCLIDMGDTGNLI